MDGVASALSPLRRSLLDQAVILLRCVAPTLRPMAVVRPGATVRALSSRALSDVEGLVDLCLPLLVAAEPAGFYTPERLADLHDVARAGLTSVLTVLAGVPSPDRDPLDDVRETGRRQVQQDLPLEGMLRAYRIVGQALWENFVAEARSGAAPVAESLLDGATEVWRVIDLFSSAASQAFREEEGRLRTREDRVQAAVLAALLDGQGTDPQFARDAATALGFTAHGSLVCVVGLAEVPEPLAFDNARERLHVGGLTSVWVTLAGSEVGLVISGKGGRQRIRDLLQPGVRTRAGMSPTFHSLSELPTARRLAEIAASCAGRNEGVRLLEDDLVAGLVVAAPLVASMLYERTVGRLLDASGDEGPALLSTVRAFLDTDCSLREAARTTFVHRNTMLYRLNKVDKLTETRVRSLEDQVIWVLGLRELDARG